ncbi:hypothetical protein OWR29_03160 [Actinoplanes sp. Pm04-4]|jgi:hypothetical protein|uniref:Uncharacterized protein n=1 Tax=Paractinoplanes pyxinae TaxID=2997416 RepID=A0ABT4ARX2_9ACTN|nr:hypothetical protein [Actinoplanes pyxinae]MCY1136981.1 hypothetical protein [Actinoplanes pyxinae]
MLVHPELMLTMVNDRHREMIAESEKAQILKRAREALRARRPRTARPPTGRVAPCEPSAAVPAR